MAETLTAVARVRAVTGSEETVRDALVAMVAPTREEEGCLDYRLHVVDDDPGLFYFVALAAIADHIEGIVISRMTRIA